MRILIIDNYDSFVYILAQLIGSLKAEPLVYRNDEITLEEAKRLKPDGIIISPGPGNPEDRRYFGVCSDIIRDLGKEIPLLGVCLGHQGIISTFGGKIIKAKRVLHGKVSLILHNYDKIFEGLDNPFLATRYHSLVGDKSSLPKDLEVIAFSKEDDEIMGIKHKFYPIYGLQFHPESILTEGGLKILSNFLRICKR
ncbi:Aminodeoxychorismate synthase component 2 [archaeon HR06]|nr:Aminodeoxychorismate synthase component 2 [archaeon HR06]